MWIVHVFEKINALLDGHRMCLFVLNCHEQHNQVQILFTVSETIECVRNFMTHFTNIFGLSFDSLMSKISRNIVVDIFLLL